MLLCLFMLCAPVFAFPLAGEAPDPGEAFEALGPTVVEPRDVPEPTGEAVFHVDGLDRDQTTLVRVRMVEPGQLDARTEKRPARSASFRQVDGVWRGEGDPALAEALLAVVVVEPLIATSGWQRGAAVGIRRQFAAVPDPDPIRYVNKCSCPQGVTGRSVAVDQVLGADGWPLLAVRVVHTLETTLAGGAVREESSRGSWVRTTWVRTDGPGVLEVPALPAFGSWSTHDERRPWPAPANAPATGG